MTGFIMLIITTGALLAVAPPSHAGEAPRPEPKAESKPDGKGEAKSACLEAQRVTRWEPIDGWRVLAHAGERQLAFVDLNAFQGGPYFARNGEPAMRLFASRLCVGDNVLVNGRRGRVINLEFLRGN